MNPISQEAEPQPFPSSSLNRCLQLYWVKGITDADYFMHRGGGKPSKCFNSCSLYEGKHELKQFCWTQLRVLSKGRQHLTRPEQSHQGLWGIAHKWSPEVLRGTPQASQTLDFTDTPPAQQGSTLVFHHQKQLYLAPTHTANASHLKSSGCVATVSLWIPSLVFIQVFPSAVKHQELIHVTQAMVTGVTWTRWGHLLSGHQPASSVFVTCPALFCNSCFNSSSPSELHRDYAKCPSQITQYSKLTRNHGINMNLDNTVTPTFFSCKQQPCLRHAKMFRTWYFMKRESRSFYF